MIRTLIGYTFLVGVGFVVGYLTALGPIGRALLWERVRDHLGSSQ